MDKALYFIGFFLITGWIFALSARAVQERRGARIVFIAAMAIVLTALSVYVPQVLPLRFGEELAALGWSASLKENLRGTRTNAERFLEQNCTLVDVSHDLQLVPAPDQPDSTAVVAITDRKRLATVLDMLARDTALYDVVLVDLLLDLPSEGDTLLARSLMFLAEHGKLAIARPPIGAFVPAIITGYTFDSAFGRVAESEHDGLYFRHTLLAPAAIDGPPIPSLPYRAYTLATGVERIDHTSMVFGWAREHIREESRFIRTWFNPQLSAGRLDEPGWWDGIRSELGFASGSYELSGHNRMEAIRSLNAAFPLGAVASDIRSDGGSFLKAVLSKRDQAEGPHFVVIGNFLDPERDVHQTIHGPMHGTAIIIGVLHELVQGGHHASLAFTGFILVAFATIVLVLVNRCFGKVVAKVKKASPEKTPGKNGVIKRILKSLFCDELHYWLLFIVLLIASVYFDRIINIMSMTMILGSMELVFRASVKHTSDPSD